LSRQAWLPGSGEAVCALQRVLAFRLSSRGIEAFRVAGNTMHFSDAVAGDGICNA
jgi:hypothetical protein